MTLGSDESVVIGTEQIGVVVTQPDERFLVVRDAESFTVVTVGEKGQAGQNGLNGAGAIEVAFAYGDASPAALTTVLANKIVYGVQLHITVPFDGVGAALKVGDTSQPERLMAANENDVSQVGSNTTTPAFIYGSDTQLLLTITPGAGATQGSGLAVIYVQL